MQIRILGARQGESRYSHFNGLLIDSLMALDAGSITSVLTLEEQAVIRHVLLTHQHFDHIKDLATLGFNRLGRGQITLCCTPEVRAAIEETIFNRLIWLNFFEMPTPEEPTFVHLPVSVGPTFSLEGYRIKPVPSNHPKPVTGYEIESSDGGILLYTGDAGPGSGAAWASSSPDLLITEVTYPNALSDRGAQFGHLSPDLLAAELESFRQARGSVPPVAVVHVNPYYEAQIAGEISAVACRLSTAIWLPAEGSVITVDGAGLFRQEVPPEEG
ncbi:MAG: hypothetical protein HYX94_12405 [Chloroflexi bacterium]|nr:hypothetical protein [Chloroflexota bacterium]